MSNIIEIKDLKFSYDLERPLETQALTGVSLNVKKGEFLAVIGHNGSGKSTLAKHLNGILIPTSGTVTVEGMDTKNEETIFDIRQRVGMVFQNPDNQIVATIVEEDVAFGPENLGVEPKKIRQRVDSALETVGLSEYKTHAPHKLSGGQKQRLAIAGIIAMRPECIVLDEPTAMLDPVGRKEVLSTIKKLNREEGITIVLITHYMNEAADADRIVVMDKGVIYMQGSPREVFAKVGELERIGLEAPQVTTLLHRLSEEGLDVTQGAVNVSECVEILTGMLTECRAED
ncbi:MAG: energy-coupling factor transporter ATPase [Bacillota bacterium]|nr:energy-coupling factor transporter ATPase [Bacillota bacterium]